MHQTVIKKAASVQYWDGNAKWHKLWVEHNNYHDEMADIKSKITFKDSHLWIKDTAYVGMYWWERIVAERR